MASIHEALATLGALVGSYRSVGNGECYGLASYYETLISPNGTVGLGAGVGWVSGAVGDTIKAANIGTSYNWQANGWTVSTTGPFQPGQIVTLKAVSGNIYGHVVVIEAVQGDQLTVLEQNYAGQRYPVRNVYSATSYRNGVAHYITPPGATGHSPEAGEGREYAESGVMTVTVDKVNVRRSPSTSGQIVAQYSRGQSFAYDRVKVDANGFVWVSYVGGSGQRNYVATGPTKNGQRYGDKWGTFS